MLDTNAMDPRPESRLFGDRYEVFAEIGRGGFGVVYDAFDIRLLRQVAIKLPSPEVFTSRSLARFALEIRCASRVAHRNVCRVLDAGMLSDGRPFVVMERLVGESLYASLKRSAWTPDRSIEVVLDLLAGLQAVHEVGIIHRDIKPANVILAARLGQHHPIVKLIDFGSCAEQRGEPLTTRRRCVGTPSYMTPEQIKGVRSLEPNADLYSVGVVLFEMLAGRPAFEGDLRKVVFTIVQEPFPRLHAVRPELPLTLDAIVARATARDPGERYQTAADFADALRRARLTLADDEVPTVVRRRY
jgi:eukaryotic-like serine/threonine-protein kinase